MEMLIDALYVYAQENRVTQHLRTAEYHQAIAGIEEDWKAFRSALTAEQGKELDSLLSRESVINRLGDKAVFLAGLSIGLDLEKL